MKFKRSITLILFVLLSIVLICGCAAKADPKIAQRVNEALDKAMTLESAHIKGTIDIKMSAAGQSFDMGIGFDMKQASSEDIQMSMHMTGLLEMDVDIYGAGGKYYMYMPQMSDKYIDVSSQYSQNLNKNKFVDMSMFDFDADTTSMNVTEDSATGALKADVHLNNEQMKKLIEKVYAEQNMGSDTVSGQSSSNLEMLKSMNIESAQYTIYLDKNNNLTKCELNAKISVNTQGQNVKLDMTANYDVLETGDSVKVEIPQIQPGDIITYEDFTGGIAN